MIDNKRKVQLKQWVKKKKIPCGNFELLDKALTHESYSFESQKKNYHNEQLEFLGDSILGLVITEYLYEKYIYYDVGELAKMKALLVSRSALFKVSEKLEIGPVLNLGKGEDSYQGRKRVSIVSDATEAVLGAVFKDKGINKCKALILALYKDLFLNIDSISFDYKTTLQEKSQKTHKISPKYKVLREEGPPHDKTFEVAVIVNGVELGTGRGKSKKEAEQKAAEAGLKKIE